MSTLSFSGHESFQCRNLWLKKGYEFASANKTFTDDLAVVDLGVGKNMVSSIKFWLKAFELLDEDGTVQELAQMILDENGSDPYLEDIGTLWLLHYHLVTSNQGKEKETIYSLFFNNFRKKRVEFSKEHLMHFLISECNHRNESHSENTIDTDIGVLLKNYVRPKSEKNSKSIEDDFSSLLFELDLIKPIADRQDWFECKNEYRSTLPTEIVFYSILSNPDLIESKSISFNHILNDENSAGLVFALNADSLLEHIKTITQRFDGVTYTEDAGIREIQFNEEYKPLEVLEEYYA
jgi:hypothetical protein